MVSTNRAVKSDLSRFVCTEVQYELVSVLEKKSVKKNVRLSAHRRCFISH